MKNMERIVALFWKYHITNNYLQFGSKFGIFS